jgi:hypothetical protein
MFTLHEVLNLWSRGTTWGKGKAGSEEVLGKSTCKNGTEVQKHLLPNRMTTVKNT